MNLALGGSSMKQRGATTKYDREEIRKAIDLYYKSTLSWDEVAVQVGIPKAVLFYHRRKELKTYGQSGTEADR